MQSADKKPETYVGPDGKTKIRMVPVDREVVKSENSQLAKLKLINKIKRSGVVKTGSMSKNEAKDPEEYDNEGSMMKGQLRQICSANEKLMSMVKDDDNLPEWVQSKVTKATDYIRSVRDYLESEKMEESTKVSDVNEAATPAMKKAADELNSYAKKSGGIDKADFMKTAKMLSTGKAGMALIKFVDGQDTEVYEKILTVMAKHMGKQTIEKMFKVKVREEAATNEANTYVGQRDQMKITDRKPHPDGGHIVTLQTKAGKTIKRHLKNGKVKDIKEAQLDELTAAEKKLVNQMYDKKGNLTPMGKKVMNHGKKPGDKGYVESVDEALERDGPKKPDIFGPKGSFGKSASTTPAVQKYMAKRAAANRARNKAMDPGADKKGYGIGVTDTDKADKKAKAKGTSMMKRMGSRGKMHKAGKMM